VNGTSNAFKLAVATTVGASSKFQKGIVVAVRFGKRLQFTPLREPAANARAPASNQNDIITGLVFDGITAFQIEAYQRSSTNVALLLPEQQIIIVLLESRSVSESTASR
jgi:hypothetical protein